MDKNKLIARKSLINHRVIDLKNNEEILRVIIISVNPKQTKIQ